MGEHLRIAMNLAFTDRYSPMDWPSCITIYCCLLFLDTQHLVC